MSDDTNGRRRHTGLAAACAIRNGLPSLTVTLREQGPRAVEALPAAVPRPDDAVPAR